MTPDGQPTTWESVAGICALVILPLGIIVSVFVHMAGVNGLPVFIPLGLAVVALVWLVIDHNLRDRWRR